MTIPLIQEKPQITAGYGSFVKIGLASAVDNLDVTR
jgi:hypothetical protein